MKFGMSPKIISAALPNSRFIFFSVYFLGKKSWVDLKEDGFHIKDIRKGGPETIVYRHRLPWNRFRSVDVLGDRVIVETGVPFF